jgi:predicted esterase
MTRQDRELLIADNVAYANAAVATAADGRQLERLTFCGFSQGVAMAFRAGLLGARKADAVLALGGEIPPELLTDPSASFPRVLLARGARDEWYTGDKLQADAAALTARGVHVDTLTFDGAHEWHVDYATRAAELLQAFLR